MAEGKKGRGCFFYGCVTLIVLAIVAIIAIFFGVRYGIKYVRDHYTAKQGVAVAPVALPPAEGADVVKRVDDFKRQIQSGTATNILVLSGDELDYWIRNSAGPQLRDHVHVTITNDQIQAQLSMPLDAFGPAWHGRFLNGNADVGVGVRNGMVAFDFRSLTVGGQTVPPQALAGMNQNMQWKLQPNDPNAALVTGFDKIDVKDGKIILHPKGAP
jgi:hypothetical protein